MKRTIKVNPLDPESIDTAIKAIEEYEEFIEQKRREFVELLTDLGVEKAKEIVPIRTGVAQESIMGYVFDDHGFVKAGGYCAFIEFGTGVMGEGSKHPSPEYLAIMNWAYNEGITIFTTKEGKIGWYYPLDEARTQWRFTQGMPSRPFLFETAVYLKKEAPNIAKELFEQ